MMQLHLLPSSSVVANAGRSTPSSAPSSKSAGAAISATAGDSGDVFVVVKGHPAGDGPDQAGQPEGGHRVLLAAGHLEKVGLGLPEELEEREVPVRDDKHLLVRFNLFRCDRLRSCNLEGPDLPRMIWVGRGRLAFTGLARPGRADRPRPM